LAEAAERLSALFVSLKRLLAAPSPEGDRLFAIFALKLGGYSEERTKQDRAIIVGEFN
jgi:hypothetical protein